MGMDKARVLDYLKRSPIDNIYPIFVPSIFRPNHYFYKTVVKNMPEHLRKRVYYVVRDGQYLEYKQAQPDVKFLPLPKNLPEGFGLDSTRMYIEEQARLMGYDKILDVDDDINTLTFVYDAGDTSRRLTKGDSKPRTANILSRLCQESDLVFDQDKRAVMGSPCRIFPSTAAKDYSNTRWIINGMSIPRQFMAKHVGRMGRAGIIRTGAYDKHCEDVGFAATCLERGGHLFRLPCFIYDVPSHEANPRTEAILHHAEPEELWQDGEKHLRESSIAEYLSYTSANSDRGNKPRPVGVNWKKWNRDKGWTTVTEEWENENT